MSYIHHYNKYDLMLKYSDKVAIHYNVEDSKKAYERCEALLSVLNGKVNNFDNSLDALNDFIKFIDNITNDMETFTMLYGQMFRKIAIIGLCIVLQNKKLFMIYRSRGLGAQIIWNYIPYLAMKLKERNELDNIRHVLNLGSFLEKVRDKPVDCDEMCISVPELRPYIEEIKTIVASGNYIVETYRLWQEESNAWFGDNPNTFDTISYCLYY